jgi:hypothetical protein
MNKEKAKEISIEVVTEALGGVFSHKGRANEFWYFSPFRPSEKTASFRINKSTNRWYDFGHTKPSYSAGKAGIGSGGDAMDLWCDVNFIDRRTGMKEALRYLEKFASHSSTDFMFAKTERPKELLQQPEPSRFKIIKLHDNIFYPQLKDELARRCISAKTAASYLKQVFLQDAENPDRKINGFAWANDKGGYEVSIPNLQKGSNFKTAIAPKAITTVEGEDLSKAAVFESMWDFLTHLEMQKLTVPHCLTYVMNSTKMVSELIETVIAQKDTLKTAILYSQNDTAGTNAMHEIAAALEPHGFEIGTMEQSYSGFKDLNDWYINSKNTQAPRT